LGFKGLQVLKPDAASLKEYLALKAKIILVKG
jgi:hypothetical protein